MPENGLDQAVDVLFELPGQAALADTGRPGNRYESDARVTARGVEQLLEKTQLLVAADEGRLRYVGPALAAALGDDPQRAPGGDRARLALQNLWTGLLEGDGHARRAMSGVADEHGSRRRGALQSSRRVDQIPGDHPLVLGIEAHRGLASQDAAPGLNPGPERADGVDEVQRCPDGSFGIVLAGGRRAPDGHDRVADELLDDPAVAADDVRCQLEVAGQRVADVLRVALLGERGEADEIGEQDRHEATLRARARRGVCADALWGSSNRGRSGCRGGCRHSGCPDESQPAFATEFLAGGIRRPAVGACVAEPRPALPAELLLGRIGGTAGRADHEPDLPPLTDPAGIVTWTIGDPSSRSRRPVWPSASSIHATIGVAWSRTATARAFSDAA